MQIVEKDEAQTKHKVMSNEKSAAVSTEKNKNIKQVSLLT